MPERWPASKEAIFSLKGQVRQLYVYWNGDEYPEDLKTDWITVTCGPNRGDFSKLTPVPGEFLTCDDDLIYPKTYVRDFEQFIEAFPNCILTHHGKTLEGGVKNVVHCLRENTDTKRVDIPGTGVSYFPARIYGELLREIEYDWNCLDVLVGSWMKKKGVKAYALPHPADYFGYIAPPKGTTIWEMNGSRIEALHKKYL